MAEQQQIYKSEIDRIWKAQFNSLSRTDEPQLTEDEKEEEKKARQFARIVDLRNANARGIAFENRRRIIAAFSPTGKATDSGYPEVQGEMTQIESVPWCLVLTRSFGKSPS